MMVVDGRVTQCFIVRGWREVKNTRVPRAVRVESQQSAIIGWAVQIDGKGRYCL